jgi:hypothetical protein
MSPIFILTTIFIALTIVVEAILLSLQWNDRRLTRWLGTHAFIFFAFVVLTLWFFLLYLLICLQYEEHPLFHTSAFVQHVGLVLFFAGIILAAWSFSLLGVKRALCINFFVDNVPLGDRIGVPISQESSALRVLTRAHRLCRVHGLVV